MGNRWYIIFVLLTFIGVSQMLKVGGVLGEYVILNCSFTNNNSEEISVHWRDGNGKSVYDIINGSGKPGSEYQGRVSSFSEEYQNGNYSIKIKPLAESDAGTYQCLITCNSRQHSESAELYFFKEKPGEKDQIESKGISSANELYAVLFMCLCFIVLYAKVA